MSRRWRRSPVLMPALDARAMAPSLPVSPGTAAAHDTAHVSLGPTWFDPAEGRGIITPVVAQRK